MLNAILCDLRNTIARLGASDSELACWDAAIAASAAGRLAQALDALEDAGALAEEWGDEA